MKKVLFITYYWPPSGKASIHWPLKIIKYLPKYEWQPSVLTARRDVFSQPDESLLKDIAPDLKIIRTSSYEPFELYKKFLGKEKDEILVASETISDTNTSLAHKISVWIRMNLFIPDARVGWFPPAAAEGKDFLKQYPQNAIVTIGPPHTAHLIGMHLSKKFNIPHVPVFIDPWTDIIYYRGFKRSGPTVALDNYLEEKVLRHAASVVFVTDSMREDYFNKYNFLSGKSDVLYWGYNEEDFNDINFTSQKQTDTETIIHAGNIFDYQNPQNFWKQIKKEISSGRNIKIKFIGSVSSGIKNEIEKIGLQDSTTYAGFLPYNEMLKELIKADYLLVCATEKRHLPGKLFEYLRTGNPIIAFGDDNSDVKNILDETHAGKLFSYSESAEEILRNTETYKAVIGKVKKYDRKIIAEKFAEILNKLTS